MPANFIWCRDRNKHTDLMSRIGKLTSDGNHDAAIAAAIELRDRCIAEGIDSATAYWALAVVHDNAGKLFEALDYILQAVRRDVLSHAVDQSLSIILNRVRDRLLTGDWSEVEASMYETLANEGLAEDDVRLAYGGYLLAEGRAAEALKVAQGVAMFSPRSAPAWELVEAAALALNDLIVATDARNSSLAAKTANPEPRANMACAQA